MSVDSGLTTKLRSGAPERRAVLTGLTRGRAADIARMTESTPS
jgi:hypothetical protein